MAQPKEKAPIPASRAESNWGEEADDHFGYASDDERRARRGLEDWELVEKIPESQADVPRWFFAIIVAVALIAVTLSFPFWGDRPGYERQWVDWGFGAALVYVMLAGGMVYFMVMLYGSVHGGRLDSDQEKIKQDAQN